ncbi:WD40-repeat-containing domain protein [Sphaerosporella brunnea]|uniref:WD40-repeat-containing domain protein n=1 Tax=Sphaerosporella brunnea TaxID=1250544 RepID=A0A5J5EI13_9PEZI|nr:WD40-repeat-containing domain protein [Sphaerosporella brunnea]
MPAAVALTVHWSERDEPIYSAHFEPHGKGRLATAGGDNNVRIWKIEGEGDERKPVYLSTLSKHNQAVNVVRWCPRGEMLASAGDDGNIILWVPAEPNHRHAPGFGDDDLEDKETWRLKHMCRSMGSEIYDLAWSPDGMFFITGSMDNIARVWNAQTGQMVRQIAEHNHYVQGVAWDPLNEFVATQSSDRSVHIYTLKSKDGQFSLSQHGKISRMDLPTPRRRISSNSPAPPDMPLRSTDFPPNSSAIIQSPAPSTPGTPTSFSLPMNPPLLTASRRSSFSSSPSLRRSPSPSPALPLPAVKPMDFSPKVHGLGVKNANIYYNETLTSFFRRLTFTPDGSLLLTPAGQYKVSNPTPGDGAKSADDIINTVYIYTRAGLNKPPIAHLPGHKKPSIAIKCSPVLYTLRTAPVSTKNITVDTSSADDNIPSLPPPAVTTQMQPPPPAPGVSLTPSKDVPSTPSILTSAAFSLPYRMVYAVATQDAVLIYDTQQQTPLCVVSNLHYAAFTDLTWSSDGLTLLMTSTDGFCSVVMFAPGELGERYMGPINHISGIPTPTFPACIPSSKMIPTSVPPLSPAIFPSRPPSSPARSSSVSSVGTITPSTMNNPTPTMGSLPSVAATASGIPLTTPPQTPMAGGHGSTAGSTVLGKRDPTPSSKPDSTNTTDKGCIPEAASVQPGGDKKRRRIAPTLVMAADKSS